MIKYDENKPLTNDIVNSLEKGSKISLTINACRNTYPGIIKDAKNKGIEIEILLDSYEVEKRLKINLTLVEQLDIIATWCKFKPEIVSKILKADKYACPFPFRCNRFPCDDMYCNADTMNNGYAYKMS